MRDRLDALPWTYVTDHPADLHHAMVTKYWPEDLVLTESDLDPEERPS